MSRPGPSRRVRRGVGRSRRGGCARAGRGPRPAAGECGHGGRGGRGEAVPGAPSGVMLESSKSSATRSSTPCAALSCSSIVRSGRCAASGIRQHTVPFVSPEVKSDSRLGEGRAMAGGLGDQKDAGQRDG